MAKPILIRAALPADLDSVIALDEVSTGERKKAYWPGVFDRYVGEGRDDRIFLVAETGGKVVGFIIGEIRAWEFGAPPCGWVFALSVSPEAREASIGQQLFEEICRRLKKGGVATVKTMVDLDNRLTLSFFRSQGLRTGRFVELEKKLD